MAAWRWRAAALVEHEVLRLAGTVPAAAVAAVSMAPRREGAGDGAVVDGGDSPAAKPGGAPPTAVDAAAQETPPVSADPPREAPPSEAGAAAGGGRGGGDGGGSRREGGGGGGAAPRADDDVEHDTAAAEPARAQEQALVAATVDGSLYCFYGLQISPVCVAADLGVLTCVAVGDVLGNGRNAAVAVAADGRFHLCELPRPPAAGGGLAQGMGQNARWRPLASVAGPVNATCACCVVLPGDGDAVRDGGARGRRPRATIICGTTDRYVYALDVVSGAEAMAALGADTASQVSAGATRGDASASDVLPLALVARWEARFVGCIRSIAPCGRFLVVGVEGDGSAFYTVDPATGSSTRRLLPFPVEAPADDSDAEGAEEDGEADGIRDSAAYTLAVGVDGARVDGAGDTARFAVVRATGHLSWWEWEATARAPRCVWQSLVTSPLPVSLCVVRTGAQGARPHAPAAAERPMVVVASMDGLCVACDAVGQSVRYDLCEPVRAFTAAYFMPPPAVELADGADALSAASPRVDGGAGEHVALPQLHGARAALCYMFFTTDQRVVVYRDAGDALAVARPPNLMSELRARGALHSIVDALLGDDGGRSGGGPAGAGGSDDGDEVEDSAAPAATAATAVTAAAGRDPDARHHRLARGVRAALAQAAHAPAYRQYAAHLRKLLAERRAGGDVPA